jgi:serine/threonine protein kinase
LQPELKRDFALKIIPAAAVAHAADRKRLADEARKLAGCEHPSLVKVTDLDFHDGRPFVVMEHVRGPNLERYRVLSAPDARKSAQLVADLEVRRRVGAPVAMHPYEHPHFWAAFILTGVPD